MLNQANGIVMGASDLDLEQIFNPQGFPLVRVKILLILPSFDCPAGFIIVGP
jgi:hypothetical protein